MGKPIETNVDILQIFRSQGGVEGPARHLGGELSDRGVGDRGVLGGRHVDEGLFGLVDVVGGEGGGISREGLRNRHHHRVSAVPQPLGSPLGVGESPVDGVAISGVRARVHQGGGELAAHRNQLSTHLDGLVLVDDGRFHPAQPVGGMPGRPDQSGDHQQRNEDENHHRRPP